MKEDLLHFIWQSKILLKQNLLLSDKNPIEIISVGTLNHDAGPDFFNAKIKIDNEILVGNIEIHIKASDWLNHKHTGDKKYENVILHVVYENDKPIFDQHNIPLLTLELKNYLDPELLNKYQILKQQKNEIPCKTIFNLPNEFKLNHWLHRLVFERLENKCGRIETLLKANNNNWEQTFYVLTAQYFGQKTNEQAFEWLAKNLPLQIIAKHKDKLSQIEALVLGTAGFFDKELKDDYLKFLQKEYFYLQKKYDLVSIDKSIWKFGKMRPGNFPTIRLMQFAALLYQSSHLFSKILAVETIKDLQSLYQLKHIHLIHLSELSNHDFDAIKTDLGKSAINTIIINTVVPIVFLYGKLRFDESKCDKAVAWLEQIIPEKNSIIEFWETLNIKPQNAAQSQALLQLKNEYCANKKCLNCEIGFHILNNN
ncbi:MAG: DUF2851 family protein [Bacteroidia bacterium]